MHATGVKTAFNCIHKDAYFKKWIVWVSCTSTAIHNTSHEKVNSDTWCMDSVTSDQPAYPFARFDPTSTL